jgi:hypothetical protein
MVMFLNQFRNKLYLVFSIERDESFQIDKDLVARC